MDRRLGKQAGTRSWKVLAQDLDIIPSNVKQLKSFYQEVLGWDVSREQHRNMYTIKGETDHQPRLDA